MNEYFVLRIGRLFQYKTYHKHPCYSCRFQSRLRASLGSSEMSRHNRVSNLNSQLMTNSINMDEYLVIITCSETHSNFIFILILVILAKKGDKSLCYFNDSPPVRPQKVPKSGQDQRFWWILQEHIEIEVSIIQETRIISSHSATKFPMPTTKPFYIFW